MSDLSPPQPEPDPPSLSDLWKEMVRRFPAGRELFEQTRKRVVAEVRARVKTAERLDKERTQGQVRLRRLGLSLLTGGLHLPPRTGRPHREPLLVDPFRTLRNQEFLSLAQVLHEQLGTHSPVGWQMVLTDTLFYHGLPEFIHGLLSRPAPAAPIDAEEEGELLREYRQEYLRVLSERVLRESGKPVEASLAVLFTTVIARTLLLSWDLLTTIPPGWFILPTRGDPFDPVLHQAIPGRPTSNAQVSGLIFPGYLLRTGSDKVVEKAHVYTTAAPATAGETDRPGSPPVDEGEGV